MQTQVTKDHYLHEYDNLERFISYYYQCSQVIKLKPQKVLEIGVGNKITSNYLRNQGINVITCDVDKGLKPDVIASVTKLPFKNKEFDCVICYQVLEHLPFEQFEIALKEIKRVTKRNAIISLPYCSISAEILLKMPLLNRLLKKNFIDLSIRIPSFWKEHRFDGQHYWELGTKNYSLNKIRKEISKKFKILNEIRPEINNYHHFFILETINSETSMTE